MDGRRSLLLNEACSGKDCMAVMIAAEEFARISREILQGVVLGCRSTAHSEDPFCEIQVLLTMQIP